MIQPFLWAFAAIAAVAVGQAAAVRRAEKEKKPAEGFYPILNLGYVWQLAVFFAAIGLLLCLAYTGEHPFVYFQF